MDGAWDARTPLPMNAPIHRSGLLLCVLAMSCGAESTPAQTETTAPSPAAMDAGEPEVDGHSAEVLADDDGGVTADAGFTLDEDAGVGVDLTSQSSSGGTLHRSILKWGLHPDASDALRSIGITAAGISQTIGNAAASAGTHAQDGVAQNHPYSAATDLRVRGWSSARLKALLDALGHVGFAAWYRNPGSDHWPAGQVVHIHAVYAGAPMKHILRDQVHDFLHGRNGLASHAAYAFHQPDAQSQDKVRALFLAHNPVNN